MANFLGNPERIESLWVDLRDLQSIIADISHNGTLCYPLWQLSDTRVKLGELMEFYKYTESHPEYNQHSHIVLLELVIDRLLLLLRSFTGYAELLMNKQEVPRVQVPEPRMSAGLAARRLWSSIVTLGNSYLQLLDEEEVSKTELPQLRPTPQAGNPKEKRLKNRLPELLKRTSSQGINPVTFRFPAHGAGSDTSSSSLFRDDCSVDKRTCSVDKRTCSMLTQTSPLAPGPCATCAGAWAALRELNPPIADLYQSQNIPSALGRLQAEQENAGRRTLSTSDVNYWALEQSKDLSRIEKQLRALEEQVTPLKAALVQEEKEELQQQVEGFSRCLKAERESKALQKKEAELTLALKQEEHIAAVARLEQEKEELRKGACLLEERFCALQKEMAMKKEAEQELEVSKATLLEELRRVMDAMKHDLELDRQLQLVSSQQENLTQKLSSTSKELEEGKTMVRLMWKQQEAIHAKQKVLLQHLDSLEKQHQELMGEVEEKVADLVVKMEQSGQQSEQQLWQSRRFR